MRFTMMSGVLATVLGLTACEGMNDTERRVATGAGIGAATGAVTGAVSGGNAATGGLVGGALGAGGGYLYDKQQRGELD